MGQIMTERDILGTQLVRRNDELALLYEKIRIQQSTLSKGEQQYRDRINDIRLLKLEIKKLRWASVGLNLSAVHTIEKRCALTAKGDTPNVSLMLAML